MSFKLGQTVSWTLKGNSFTGKVVKIVPAQEPISKAEMLSLGSILNLSMFRYHTIKGGAFAQNRRHHESYIVAVESGSGKPMLYHPTVHTLSAI